MSKFYILSTLIVVFCGCSQPNKPSLSQKKTITEGFAPGNKAPEIRCTAPNGNELSLSSLKGKLVLIDFWASWCPPCRRENPNIVRAFVQYHDKKFTKGDGFTIFSISLDTKHAAWTQAIIADNLSWQNHVSDLKGWGSDPAKFYNIEAIPSNLLIDKEGIIIARNLTGDDLLNTLQSLLKN